MYSSWFSSDDRDDVGQADLTHDREVLGQQGHLGCVGLDAAHIETHGGINKLDKTTDLNLELGHNGLGLATAPVFVGILGSFGEQ